MASTTQEEILEIQQWLVSRGPWECGLFIGHPGFGQDLSLEVENTGDSAYSRQTYEMSDPTLGTDLSNAEIIEFNNLPDATITHWGLFLSGDNTLRYVGALDKSISVYEGESIRAPAGTLSLEVK